jgi:ribosomal protein S18 acetylase RimI-like enzyme
MKPEIVLRKLEIEDLPQIAVVHINSFPESALTRLGASIVERYYLWQLTGPHEKVHAVGAFVAGDCAGFSFSGKFSGSTSGFIKQNKMFLAKKVLLRPRLLFNPLFQKRLTEGVKLLAKFSRKKPARQNSDDQPRISEYGILSIAVSGKYQKSGIGQMLMLDAENEALKYGYREICLTVHPDNKKAVRFYEKLDWQKFPPNDLWRGAMIKLLK